MCQHMATGHGSGPNLPPEGLGMELAPAGPFFFGGRIVAPGALALRDRYHHVVMRAIVVSMLVMMAASCAPRAESVREEPVVPKRVERPVEQVEVVAKPQASKETQAEDAGELRAAHEPAPQVKEDLAKDAPVEVAPVEEAPAASSQFVQPFPGVSVRVNPPTVEIESIRCLDVGFLEQIACSPNTREHEALVVVMAKPSHIHAAMLMAGFEPGAPGKWIYHDEEKRIEVRPPTGPKVRVMMRYEKDGKTIEEPAVKWIRDHLGEQTFPDKPWIFAGSLFAENPEFMGPGEHYVADETGSIIGLVTFGDELLGYSEVIADQEDVTPAEWEVDDRAAPPVDTKVTIVITPWEE